MDRKQLEVNLQDFRAECLRREMPLLDMCIFEAYPGDASTSYIIQVKAQWIEEMDCSVALEFLFDVLWETTTEELRKHIFSIEILNSKDELHCFYEGSEFGETAKLSFNDKRL